jgi:hypothetical protein
MISVPWSRHRETAEFPCCLSVVADSCKTHRFSSIPNGVPGLPDDRYEKHVLHLHPDDEVENGLGRLTRILDPKGLRPGNERHSFFKVRCSKCGEAGEFVR